MTPVAAPASRAPRRFPVLASGALSVLSLAAGCSKPAPSRPSLPGGIAAAPLRAAKGGETPRFRRVPATESGLDFTNLLRRENSYTYLTNGAGLAVGDYDGDGLVDAYLVSQDGPNQLFRQTAPLRFENVTATAGQVDGGDAWGTGATFADVDGDGDLDLYVCNLEAKNLLYQNQGDGTFRENAAAFGLDLVAASTMAAFADYDRDGSLDCYLLTNRTLHAGWAATPEVLHGLRPGADTTRAPAAMVPTLAQLQRLDAAARAGKLGSDADLPPELREQFLVFRGQRFMTGEPDRLLRSVGGRFVDVSHSSGIHGTGMGLSATWWDYDADGYPDLYVANDLESPDVLYHNERNGTFRAVTKDVLPHTAYYGMGSDAGDIDGDGWLDFLVADMSMTTHQKAKVLMGDMNEERAVLMHAEPPQCMRNALFRNTGRGRFEEIGHLAGLASTDWTWSVLFGDLDQDGRLDVFATNGIARFDTDPDLDLRVKQLWAEKRQQAAIELIQNVRKVAERNLALRNAGELRFTKTGGDWGLDLEAVSHGAALCDFDGDGDLDVLVNNWNEPAALYENRTTDGAAIVVRLRGQASERFGIGARVAAKLADGKVLVRENWLSRGYLSGQAPELHFGLGAASAVAELHVQWPSGHEQRFQALAAGQRYTITEPPGPAPQRARPAPPAGWTSPTTPPPFAHRENDFDEYASQPLLPAEVSRSGPGMALGDADGDGALDLFVGGASGQSGALLLAAGDGWRLQPGPWQQDAAGEDLGVLWLDHDGDGDLDLFVARGGAERPAGDPLLRPVCYRNDGKLAFARDDAVLPDLRTSSGQLVAADFDGDGDLDLLLAGRLVPGAYPEAPPSRLLRNDGGRFVDVTAELAPALLQAGMVTSALFTDVDADGFVDLLLAAHWQPVRLLRNERGQRFVDATTAAGLAAHTGWWNSLCAWDVDADGDLDYVAGNHGRNSKYKADAQHPAQLYFGDFDDNGTRDLIEAKYQGDQLLPVRGRSCSSQAMPFLVDKFPTYEKFANSLLQDIYTAPKLASCGQLQATTLASCLLRNDGKGQFTLEELPRAAQVAPIFGMVALGDLLVCAQNSFAPEPETGRADGGTGLVLRAASGELQVVPAIEHGLAEFGDHKALVARPTAAGVELLFARNDGPLHSHRWSVPGSPLQQLLPPPPPGTRVLVRHGDRTRAVEVACGSGYLSQGPVLVPAGATVERRLPDGSTAPWPTGR
ncbi:MAG: VCBS repeat-containing protein [Planctomycetes bacterium]|nr:VCBS repeat-containing protein [Planctomycetota bacterium]